MVIRPSASEAFPETTFLGADMPVPASSWEMAVTSAVAQGPDWLAICGSIPGWERRWTKPLEDALLANPDMAICVDTYGPPLRDLVELPLELVKINRKELLGLVAEQESVTPSGLLTHLKQRFPVRNWIITDGAGKIATSFAGSGSIEITPAPVEEVSATGSGDAFLAVFLGNWKSGEDPAEALSLATACATANAASKGIGDFPVPPPENLRPELKRDQA
jgi:fructose-1-phosphate kinase PfkB-like protein